MMLFTTSNKVHLLWLNQLCRKGIKVTTVCPGPIETSNDSVTRGKVSSEVNSNEIYYA